MSCILIASDIHGSAFYADKLAGKIEARQPEKILLLGDFYYNGARNDPPEGYAPKEVVRLLNGYADRIIAVRGNCESEVDGWVSDFSIVDMAWLHYFGKDIVMAHGHHASFDALPKGHYDIFLQGHTHVGVLRKEGEVILANPGSVSLPKDGRHSYMMMSDKGMNLLDLLTDEVVIHLSF